MKESLAKCIEQSFTLPKRGNVISVEAASDDSLLFCFGVSDDIVQLNLNDKISSIVHPQVTVHPTHILTNDILLFYDKDSETMNFYSIKTKKTNTFRNPHPLKGAHDIKFYLFQGSRIFCLCERMSHLRSESTRITFSYYIYEED